MNKVKNKKAWYKKWWVWLIIVIIGIAAISSTIDNKDKIDDKVNNAANDIKNTTSDAKDKIDNVTNGDTQYKKITVWVEQNVRGYAHYLYTGSGKPSEDDVKTIMASIVKDGCGDGLQVCNYFLWDSQEAYENGNDDVRSSSPASETAARHKDHLIGYVNSGYAFYYYGTSPSEAEGGMLVLDPETGKYTDMNP